MWSVPLCNPSRLCPCKRQPANVVRPIQWYAKGRAVRRCDCPICGRLVNGANQCHNEYAVDHFNPQRFCFTCLMTCLEYRPENPGVVRPIVVPPKQPHAKVAATSAWCLPKAVTSPCFPPPRPVEPPATAPLIKPEPPCSSDEPTSSTSACPPVTPPIRAKAASSLMPPPPPPPRMNRVLCSPLPAPECAKADALVPEDLAHGPLPQLAPRVVPPKPRPRPPACSPGGAPHSFSSQTPVLCQSKSSPTEPDPTPVPPVAASPGQVSDFDRSQLWARYAGDGKKSLRIHVEGYPAPPFGVDHLQAIFKELDCSPIDLVMLPGKPDRHGPYAEAGFPTQRAARTALNAVNSLYKKPKTKKPPVPLSSTTSRATTLDTNDAMARNASVARKLITEYKTPPWSSPTEMPVPTAVPSPMIPDDLPEGSAPAHSRSTVSSPLRVSQPKHHRRKHDHASIRDVKQPLIDDSTQGTDGEQSLKHRRGEKTIPVERPPLPRCRHLSAGSSPTVKKKKWSRSHEDRMTKTARSKSKRKHRHHKERRHGHSPKHSMKP